MALNGSKWLFASHNESAMESGSKTMQRELCTDRPFGETGDMPVGEHEMHIHRWFLQW